MVRWQYETTKDHPHACGDKSPTLGDIIPFRGIIPTRVGTSGKLDVYGNPREDHPHACGDKRCASGNNDIELGSSPRVWGQVSKTKTIYRVQGIIPTRVGTRELLRRLALPPRDHPHACGDKLRPRVWYAQCMGSSPRVWGQVHHQLFPP